MKNILILGAGMVARPLVRYLLDQDDFTVVVASRTVSKAEKLIEDHPRGRAQQLDIANVEALVQLISSADLVVSLVPYAHHIEVAGHCITYRKPMVTTSYVSGEMETLDGSAKEAGVILLNEIGLDPGIDHMSAMKIIDDVQNGGGKVVSFCSYCGALPAPESAKNPFRYKFAWSPRGVVLAAKNDARYLKNGQQRYVPGSQLFDDCSTITIEPLGDFAVYPNRNSLGYIDKYGISSAHTMFRATLRYPGWCAIWKKLAELGLLDEEPRELKGLSYRAFVESLIGNVPSGGSTTPQESTKLAVASYLKLDKDSPVLHTFEWLGLFTHEPLVLERGSALDVLAQRLLEKLKYEEGERDMVVLHHEFVAEDSQGSKEKVTSTLIDYGTPGGDTAVARTVALPAAIGSKLILDGKIDVKGVHIPTIPSIYEPVLEELEHQGIVCSEKSEPLTE
jgi:saccharopine dehydrogenase-like NADP-dependent oxidoreductase